jgi:cyclopropane fatty-acyl-phospholipid synthase-like methyltransferase
MTHPDKPFSEACEENKAPIRDVLANYLGGRRSVLEIGSGTGQHAVAFAAAFPSVTWQASDIRQNLPGIRRWIEEAGLANLPGPIELDVTGTWPKTRFDAVFSANTAHIMSDAEVEAMLRGIPRVLARDGLFALYGPFNYEGGFTSESNARFHQWLKARDPASGIKDVETLDELARAGGLELVRDHEMPVNNRTLVWRKPRP